jgi:hypothetical protein
MTPRVTIYIFSREAFQISLLLYMIALGAEIIKPGVVTNFLNLNIILVVVLVSGITMALTEKKSH